MHRLLSGNYWIVRLVREGKSLPKFSDVEPRLNPNSVVELDRHSSKVVFSCGICSITVKMFVNRSEASRIRSQANAKLVRTNTKPIYMSLFIFSLNI